MNLDAEPSRQRARPPRCEAAPPKPKGPRAGRGGFLEVARDRVVFLQRSSGPG